MKPTGFSMLLSLPCEAASRLASDALDRELTRFERLALRLHTISCRGCRRFKQQLQVLRELWTNIPDASRRAMAEQLPTLSAARKRKIKQLLSDARQADMG